MVTSLAVWGGPGPAPFHARVIIQPVVPSVPVAGISDTAFRRKKKRKQQYQLKQIGKPAIPVSVVRVPDAEPIKRDFRTLAELSGTSLEAFRAEMDREIATLMRKAQEDDDEEALIVIINALED